MLYFGQNLVVAGAIDATLLAFHAVQNQPDAHGIDWVIDHIQQTQHMGRRAEPHG